MILEVADIRIAPGRQADFEQAAHRGIQTVISKSKGFLGYQVRHSIESPDRYLLLLEWQALEDHTVGFRGSAAYAEWRSIVMEFFAAPPHVEHFSLQRPYHPNHENRPRANGHCSAVDLGHSHVCTERQRRGTLCSHAGPRSTRQVFDQDFAACQRQIPGGHGRHRKVAARPWLCL